jgi:hypothetical protein
MTAAQARIECWRTEQYSARIEQKATQWTTNWTPKRDYTLQGLKVSRVQFAKHKAQAKPTITNKGFNIPALLYV